MRYLFLLSLAFALAAVASAGTARSRGIRRAAAPARRSAARVRQRRFQPRHLDGGHAPGQASGGQGQAPQGYRPPGVSYDAPTHGALAEQPGSGAWQPGYGSISGDHAHPLGGAGLGGAEGREPASAPSGGSGAGGNAITPNN
jgi:hypothetical protein